MKIYPLIEPWNLLEYINGFPDFKGDYLAVRGELIISKDNWKKLKLDGENGANPRNTVSGAINSKNLNKNRGVTVRKI